MQAMEMALQQAQATIVAMRQVQEASREEIERMKEDIKERRRRQPLISQKGFDQLPKFNGKPENYDDWRFKIGVFFSQTEDLFELVQWAEDQAADIDEDDLELYQGENRNMDLKWLNVQVFSVLSLNLQEPVLALIKGLSNSPHGNGLNAWRRVTQYFAGASGQRVQSLTSKVYSPPRVKAYKDVAGAVETWELYVRQLEKAEGREIGDNSKIHGIRQLVPEELAKNAQTQSHTLKTYLQVKNYVVDQAALRRDVYMPKTLINDDPMDVGFCGQDGHNADEAMMQEEAPWSFDGPNDGEINYAGKGKGKGKGKSFAGNCHHCGAWGHRVSQCAIKDAEMRKMREKGKGDKGGKAWGGKAGGKGAWNWGKGPGQPKGGAGPQQWGRPMTQSAYWFDEAPATGHEPWQSIPGSSGTLSPLFNVQSEKPILTHNQWSALAGEDDEDENDNINHDTKIQRERSNTKIQSKRSIMSVNNKIPSERNIMGENNKIQSERNIRNDNHDDTKIQSNRSKTKIQSERSIMSENNDNHDNNLKDLNHRINEYCRNVDKKATTKDDQVNMFIQVPAGDPDDLPLNLTQDWKKDTLEWTEVKTVVDSGASESVAPPNMVPNIPVRPSAGSRRGQHYVSASGERMANQGEQKLPVVTENGEERSVTFQVTDVARPLCSVARICSQGNRVIFGARGGVIQNLETGSETPFLLEDGVYTMSLWVPRTSVEAPSPSGFPRQG